MAYSLDLRTRIVEAVEKHSYSIRQTAKLFQVGHATVERYLKQYREQGNLTPGTSTGRPRLLNAEQEELLKQQLAEHDELTLQQHCDLFEQATGVVMSYVTMHRLIRRFNISRKKRRF
jgi:transposase